MAHQHYADGKDPLYDEWIYFDTCISNRLFAPIRALDSPVEKLEDVQQGVRDKLQAYHALRVSMAELVQSLNDSMFCAPESKVAPLANAVPQES